MLLLSVFNTNLLVFSLILLFCVLVILVVWTCIRLTYGKYYPDNKTIGKRFVNASWRIQIITTPDGISVYYPQIKGFMKWYYINLDSVSCKITDQTLKYDTLESAENFVNDTKKELNNTYIKTITYKKL
jgi:hypothetical protein